MWEGWHTLRRPVPGLLLEVGCKTKGRSKLQLWMDQGVSQLPLDTHGKRFDLLDEFGETWEKLCVWVSVSFCPRCFFSGTPRNLIKSEC